MPAGSCRSILGQSHGRCQPLCHTCKMGNNYAQRYSVSPLHLGRASPILKSSSKQVNLLSVGCVGSFCLCSVPVQGRERKWEKNAKLVRDLVCYTFLSSVGKKIKKNKPMISHLLYHPAQVSWSDGLVLLVHFLPGSGEPEQ